MANIESFINAAQAEVGTRETGTNNVKYNTWFYGREVDGDNYPWCATFVSYVASKAGISERVIPKTASAGYFAYFAKQSGGEVFTGTSPQKGDLFLMGYNGNDFANHVGIVADVSNSKITTVEGNSQNQVLSRSLDISTLTFVRFDIENSGGFSADWVSKEVPNIGRDLATKSYMAYQLYTNNEADGYDYLWGDNSSTAGSGLRKYKTFYCVAMGSYYGKDGTFVKIEFEDGKIIYCVKADEKKDSETDAKHQYHDYPADRNVLEFIIDQTKIKGNEDFTNALKAESINRSSRVKAIWTSEKEPTSSSSASNGEEKEYHFYDSNEKIPLHPTIFNQPKMDCEGQNGTYKLICNNIDVSGYACDLSWENAVQTLGTVFNFSIPKPAEMKYVNIYIPTEGDIIRYSGGENEDFRGVVTEVDDGDNYKNKYVAIDAGQYLSKTKDTYQFNGMRADDCIKKICADLCIPIIEIPSLDTPISDIYADKAVSEVISDIISQAGKRLNFDFVPDGIRIYKSLEKIVKPKFRLSANTEQKDSLKYIGNISHKTSISDLKTAVKVVSDTDVLLTVKDNDTSAMYGFLQEIVKISDGEDALEKANETLDEQGKKKETFSGEIIEELTSYTRAGSCVNIGEAKYLITSSKHSVKNGVHHNQMEFERLV